MYRKIVPSHTVDFPDTEKHINISKQDFKNFEKSDAYHKYVQPIVDKEKSNKRNNRINWWKNNWINITTLIVSVLTLIATILFGLIQLKS